MEGHFILAHFSDKLGRTDLVHVLPSVTVFLIVGHLQRQYRKHEEFLFGVSLDIFFFWFGRAFLIHDYLFSFSFNLSRLGGHIGSRYTLS